MKISEVRIKSPCKEKLERSSDGCSGYFCSSCDQTVYDFRDSSEEDFNQRLEEMGTKACGIFYLDEIHPENYRYTSTPRLLSFALSLLAIIGICSSNVKAQTQNSQVENIVRDRSSHGIIPRYGLAIEPDKEVATESSEANNTIKVIKPDIEDKPFAVEIKQRRKKYRRMLFGFIPLPRKHRRGRIKL